MVDSRAAYVALALTPGMSPPRLLTLLDACETPSGALSAPLAFLCGLPGFSRAAATAVRSTREADGCQALEAVERLGGDCVLPDDAAFPDSLREIPDPPLLLFVMGDAALLARPAVAVVGSRDHSAYGAEVCRTLCTEAARAGIAVVSGMARGLDAAAHTAALDAGGATIGVLGNGLGVVYPAANRGLYERVAREGLLLTEFPPGERPHAGTFPRRNRLISALGRVTVVVEAAAGSGTLITVAAALEQGREVMAVPGNLTSPTSVGTNRLIRDGAGPYLEPGDLRQHYPELAEAPAPAPPAQVELPLPAVSPTEARVLQVLGGEVLHVDRLATETGLSAGPLLGVLCGLELAGHVVQLPGRRFRRG